MGSLFLLKKSASSLSFSSQLHKRFAISALSHLFASDSSDFGSARSRLGSSQVHSFTTKSHGLPAPEYRPRWGIMGRGFHMGRPSLFSAAFAVEDFSDDDNRGANNQGIGGAAVANDGLKLHISELGIAGDIVSALSKKGITKLFPVQSAVLKPAMAGRDLIARAKTGTGKTLAFGIPILNQIIRFNEQYGGGRRNPLALVLAPTRELARQVEKEFHESAPSLNTLCVYGGVPIMAQKGRLDRGVEIVVGTPGRVIDLLRREYLNLSEIRFVVLDEADQMLNVGFADDVETILENIRREHQTMMFSATMPSWIMKLCQKFLKNPVHIDLVGENDQKLAEGISLYAIESENNQKAAVVGSLITEHANGGSGKCIVFTQTKRNADRLAYVMQRSFKCEALHGDISQNQRERTLASFRDGRINVLVATDVAARGLDVPNVDLVIHFELPNSSESFVHRSGRTGRAGKKGTAIVMYSSDEYKGVKNIEREWGPDSQSFQVFLFKGNRWTCLMALLDAAAVVVVEMVVMLEVVAVAVLAVGMVHVVASVSQAVDLVDRVVLVGLAILPIQVRVLIPASPEMRTTIVMEGNGFKL